MMKNYIQFTTTLLNATNTTPIIKKI